MEPFATFVDEAKGDLVPLPPALAAIHGPLRFPRHPDRAHVITNFVASLDGTVAVDPPNGTGADISRGELHDRTIMGILRAVADAVIIGGGNLRAEGDHVWTAERVCPELAGPFAELRAALGKGPAPRQVVVTGSGDVDPSRAVFRGEVPSLVVTTPAGARRLGGSAAIATAIVDAHDFIPLRGVLSAAGLGAGALVLVESGPRSTTRYVAEGAIDELFLTRAPFLIGNGGATRALGLVEDGGFAPGTRPARLVSARRFGSFLYLRYAL